MRPVNLIPREELQRSRAVSKTGVLSYLVVGGLLAVLAGVVLLVLTSNQISDRKAEIAELQAESREAEARAARLAEYTSFRQVSAQRQLTVTSLADSRFDWVRVIRQLSRILPADVALTGLSGTVSPGVTAGEGPTVANRDSVPGPALSLVGCARGQEGVARFVAALKDIDGVTRVGLASSQLPTDAAAGEGDQDCQKRDFIALFQIVVAFDEAPIPLAAVATDGSVPAPPAAPPAAAEPSTDSAEAAPAAAPAPTPAGG
jgi:Tfp pilus assembly protein PilN